MAASVSEVVVDNNIFEDNDNEMCTFCLENTTWNRLEEQRHKVVFLEYNYGVEELTRNDN